MSKATGLHLYRLASRVLAPVLPFWLKRRARAGKEDVTRLSERFGRTRLERPEGPLVWLHGASVGESQMLRPLIDLLLAHDEHLHVLVTTGTVTSANLLAEHLPARAIHQYLPADTPGSVRRFLGHWQPSLGIFAESELWPNLIFEARRQNVRLALVNARMSDKSLAGWQKRPKAAYTLLSAFNYIHAADDKTSSGLSALSGRGIEPGGNLKNAAPALPVNEKELARFQTALGDRPVWCAASTHRGEDPFILDAANQVKAGTENPLLLLAPRHPERADEIAHLIEQSGLSYMRHSGGGVPETTTDVWLMDTLGQMGLAYRLSQIAFVAGALIKGLKGHNPLEPARLNCAILTGRYISSFADIYLDLFRFDAAKRILEPEQLGPEILSLLENQEQRDKLAVNAKTFALAQTDVLTHVWDEINPLLPE